jgi:Domain of unknown function (DUF4145)
MAVLISISACCISDRTSMAIITHMCPHCATDYVGLRITAVTQAPGGWAAHLHCPKCQFPSCATMKQTAPGAQSPDVFSQVPGDYLNAGWAIDEFWPESPKPLIPEYLPPDVARIYLQAERNFPILGNEEAAGIMYGKALDIGLKKIDPSLTGMLGQKIQKLSKEGKLTADMAEWSGHVRDIRNDAAHEEDPISREELIDLRNFSEMVLRYLFSLPAAVKKRRGMKLEWE